MTKPDDISGKKFHLLTALHRETGTVSGHAVWRWQCDCGNTKSILATNVKTGQIQSCGCVQATSRFSHGGCGTRTYAAWQQMKGRVAGYNESLKKYYGGRGITVCDQWRDSFEAFLKDMGECPPGLTLDRYPDNDGNYEPGNCRWATRAQQSANTRRTHFVELCGELMCLAYACKKSGIRYRTVMRRMKRGMTAQQALDA